MGLVHSATCDVAAAPKTATLSFDVFHFTLEHVNGETLWQLTLVSKQWCRLVSTSPSLEHMYLELCGAQGSHVRSDAAGGGVVDFRRLLFLEWKRRCASLTNAHLPGLSRPFHYPKGVWAAASAALGSIMQSAGLVKALHRTVVLLGLSGAGKTSVLQYFIGGRCWLEAVSPTDGFNMEQLHHPHFPLQARVDVWDVSGVPRQRSLWSTITASLKSSNIGLVFVVSAVDAECFKEASEEFIKLIDRMGPTKSEIPLLVLLNKMDLHALFDVTDVLEAFSLMKVTNPWRIQGCCVSTRHCKGLDEGFAWLLEKVLD